MGPTRGPVDVGALTAAEPRDLRPLAGCAGRADSAGGGISPLSLPTTVLVKDTLSSSGQGENAQIRWRPPIATSAAVRAAGATVRITVVTVRSHRLSGPRTR